MIVLALDARMGNYFRAWKTSEDGRADTIGEGRKVAEMQLPKEPLLEKLLWMS